MQKYSLIAIGFFISNHIHLLKNNSEEQHKGVN